MDNWPLRYPIAPLHSAAQLLCFRRIIDFSLADSRFDRRDKGGRKASLPYPLSLSCIRFRCLSPLLWQYINFLVADNEDAFEETPTFIAAAQSTHIYIRITDHVHEYHDVANNKQAAQAGS